jgi:hypothetical protein
MVTRRDMIILAVLINIVILACVLATARQMREPSFQEKEMPLLDTKNTKESVIKEEEQVSFDEIDQILEEYIPDTKKETVSKTDLKKNTKSPKPKPPMTVQNDKDKFYVMKEGDNPWKIAKKFRLSFDKLLELNHLDQEKAKNLRVGTTLRIKE